MLGSSATQCCRTALLGRAWYWRCPALGSAGQRWAALGPGQRCGMGSATGTGSAGQRLGLGSAASATGTGSAGQRSVAIRAAQR